MDDVNEEKMKGLFGENLEKLKELKRKYDPNVSLEKVPLSGREYD